MVVQHITVISAQKAVNKPIEDTGWGKKMKQKNENSSSVNIGTENKFRIQAKVLNILKTYPKNKTAREYASMLSWDIGVSFRTARENYIQPLIDKGILVHTKYDNYVLNPEHDYEESETPFMDKVKSGELKPRNDVPDS